MSSRNVASSTGVPAKFAGVAKAKELIMVQPFPSNASRRSPRERERIFALKIAFESMVDIAKLSVTQQGAQADNTQFLSKMVRMKPFKFSKCHLLYK